MLVVKGPLIASNVKGVETRFLDGGVANKEKGCAVTRGSREGRLGKLLAIDIDIENDHHHHYVLTSFMHTGRVILLMPSAHSDRTVFGAMAIVVCMILRVALYLTHDGHMILHRFTVNRVREEGKCALVPDLLYGA